MKIQTFSKEFSQRIKSVVESAEAGSVPQPRGSNVGLLAGFTSPLAITSAGKAKRLWNIDGTYKTQDEEDEFEYADPLGLSPSVGDKVFALYRGHWELIGGAEEPKIYGIITAAVGGHIFDDDEEYDENKPQGKIKIIGKEYPEDTAIADGDPCICNELAEAQDELLLIGTQVQLIKVDEIDNPDYIEPDPEADPSVEGTPDEPEKITRCAAVNTPGEYIGRLTEDVQKCAGNPDKTGEGTLILQRGVFNGLEDITGSDDEPIKVKAYAYNLMTKKQIRVNDISEGLPILRINKVLYFFGFGCPVNYNCTVNS